MIEFLGKNNNVNGISEFQSQLIEIAQKKSFNNKKT